MKNTLYSTVKSVKNKIFFTNRRDSVSKARMTMLETNSRYVTFCNAGEDCHGIYCLNKVKIEC